jgi:hypothetical protein
MDADLRLIHLLFLGEGVFEGDQRTRVSVMTPNHVSDGDRDTQKCAPLSLSHTVDLVGVRKKSSTVRTPGRSADNGAADAHVSVLDVC